MSHATSDGGAWNPHATTISKTPVTLTAPFNSPTTSFG